MWIYFNECVFYLHAGTTAVGSLSLRIDLTAVIIKMHGLIYGAGDHHNKVYSAERIIQQ